jgi:O-antigen ligase
MKDNTDLIIRWWFLLLAAAVPISIAATSVLYFPLIGLYVILGVWTFRRWPPTIGRVEKAFLCFWLISLLSAINGADPWQSRIRLGKDLYFLIAVLLGAYLGQNDRSLSTLTKVFMVSATVTACVGILQRVFGVNQSDNAGGYFLYLPPWLAHAPRPLLNHLSMVNGRAVGTRAHPLTFAEGLLFPLGYTLSVLAFRRTHWWKWAIAQGLILVGLLVSQSRGPWIAAAVMVILICLWHRKFTFYKRLALIYLPIALCFLAPSLRERASTITDKGYHSNSERLEMWQAGIRMVRDHPLLGVGPGTMNQVSPRYQLPARRLLGPWGHLHNTYVHVAAERGLLGLAAFLAFILMLGSEMCGGYYKANDVDEHKIIIFTGLLGLVGWLVAGLTETVAHDSNVLMVFYFTMGLALAASRRLLKDLKRV